MTSFNKPKSSICQVAEVLITFKADWIKMPSEIECLRASQRLEDQFGLPNFVFGIDGMMVRFENSPRRIPNGHDPQQYFGRKLFYGVTAQVGT